MPARWRTDRHGTHDNRDNPTPSINLSQTVVGFPWFPLADAGG